GLVDTGGIIPDDRELIPSAISRQARIALDEAAAIVMVVDGRSELAAPDLELARLLLRTGKPLFLAVNKIDSDKNLSDADDFHRLGIRKLFPVSAEHGRGVDDLLGALLDTISSNLDPGEQEGSSTEINVAIIGHPKVCQFNMPDPPHGR